MEPVNIQLRLREKQRHLRGKMARNHILSFANRLILHQSIIDALAGLVFFFHRIVKSPNLNVSEENSFLDHLVCRCFSRDWLLWWVYVTSTYNLVFISLERFLATCYPVKHRNMLNGRKLKIAIGTAWAIGFASASPTLLLMEPSGGHCQPVALGRKIVKLKRGRDVVLANTQTGSSKSSQEHTHNHAGD